MVTLNSSSIAVSFNIYALIKGKEYLLGGIACPANGGRASWGMDCQTDPVPFNLLFASSPPVASQRPLVTIIFRSDPGPAINSTDVSDYWDGTIELKDVPVLP
jgi:hypothetical protein